MNHQKLKARILSLTLSAAMVLTMFPVTAFAAEGVTPPQVPSDTITVSSSEPATPPTPTEPAPPASSSEPTTTPPANSSEPTTPPADSSEPTTPPADSSDPAVPPVAPPATETPVVECTCSVPCTEGKINTECKLCNAAGADLIACKGIAPAEKSAYDKVVELFTALPKVADIKTDMTEEQKVPIIAKLTAATDAYEALSPEDKERFDREHAALTELAMQLSSALFGWAPMMTALGAGDTLDMGTFNSTSKTFDKATGSGTGLYKSIVVGFTLSNIDPKESITIPTVTGYTHHENISSAYGHIITVDDNAGETAQKIAENYLRQIKFEGGNSGQAIKITLSRDALEYKTFSWGGNGHFYQYVPFKTKGAAGNTWLASYDKAKEMTFSGRKGYLATVTSLEEDKFIRTASASIGWLGGTRMALIGGVTKDDLAGTKTSSVLFQPANGENYDGDTWYWACGPEAKDMFYDTKSVTTSNYEEINTKNKTDGRYFNWGVGSTKEPNSGTNEAALATLTVGGGVGYHTGKDYAWNDLDPTSKNAKSEWDSKGFFVEYGNEKNGDSGSVAGGSIGSDTGIKPQWLIDAGLDNDAQVEYSGRPSTVKLISEVALTNPIVLPAGVLVVIDLNGNTLTAPTGQPAITVENGGKVELTLTDSTSAPGSKSPTLVGGDGQPAIDFSAAEAGSKVTLSAGTSVKGGDGGTGGSNGGDGITGSAGTAILVEKDSAATGGAGGTGAAGNGGTGGNGGNGVTGGNVTINGSATGGNGGIGGTAGAGVGGAIGGAGGDGGIGASGSKIDGTGGTATGGNGGNGTGGGAGGIGGAGTSKEKETGSNLVVNKGENGKRKATIKITGLKAPDANKVYDGTAIANGVFGTAKFDQGWTGDLVYTYSDAKGAALATPPKDAGTYTVVAAIPANNSTHEGAHAPITFTIDPKPVKVTGDGTLAVSKDYDGKNDAGTATGALALGDVVEADKSNVSVKVTVGAYQNTDVNVGTGKTVTLNISLGGSAASNYTLGTTTYSFTNAEIAKAAYKGTAATAPTLDKNGDTSITITAVTPPASEDVEYAVSTSNTAPTSDSDWQDGTTFNNLNPNTEYFFFARVKDNKNHTAGGESSPGTSITTEKSDYTTQAAKPELASRTDTSITLKAVTQPASETIEYGYSSDAATPPNSWQSGTGFSGLTPNTTYYFFARVKDNGTHKAGPASDAATIKTDLTDTQKVAAAKTKVTVTLASMTATNATTADDVLNVMNNALSSIGVTATWKADPDGFKKDLADESKEGSITGKLELTLNSDKGEADVNLPIAKIIADKQPLIDAISNAKNAKLNISTSNASSPSSVSSGTKYVSNTEMQTLIDAIKAAEAVVNKNEPTTAEVTAATATLNDAIAAFKALIKTGTYTSSGGGSTSSDGNTPPPPTAVTPKPTKPVPPTTAGTETPAVVDKNGNASVTVSDKTMQDTIDKAISDATKNGTNATGVAVVINVTTGGKDANKVTVNLPETVQDKVIAGQIHNTVVVVDRPDIAINLNLASITEINRQAKADVQLSATLMDSTKLSGEAKKAIAGRPTYDLTATYANGSKSVSNFGKGSVTIEIPYVLQKGEVAGGLYAVCVDGKDVDYITNSSYDAAAEVLRLATNHFSVYGIGYKAPNRFTDITNHWAKTDIEFVTNRGLFSGTSKSKFSPNAAMTRGMFVTALGRMAKADVSGYKTSSFRDVEPDSYYMGYIEWANKNGILNGNGDKFKPNQSITREQMAVILYNYTKAIGYTLPNVHAEKTFADSNKISSSAKDAIKAMQMAGVISGKNNNMFDPQGMATKAEVSAMLRRFIELVISTNTAQGWMANDSGKWMYYENGKPVTGKKKIDGKNYDFNQYGETADAPKNLGSGSYTFKRVTVSGK